MTNDNGDQRKRKAWNTPQLKLYGDVRQLTAGGTGMLTESSENAAAFFTCFFGSNTSNMTRKHCH